MFETTNQCFFMNKIKIVSFEELLLVAFNNEFWQKLFRDLLGWHFQ